MTEMNPYKLHISRHSLHLSDHWRKRAPNVVKLRIIFDFRITPVYRQVELTIHPYGLASLRTDKFSDLRSYLILMSLSPCILSQLLLHNLPSCSLIPEYNFKKVSTALLC